MSFSFPSYRNLCRYLGETDALVELTELACRSFQYDAKSSPDMVAFVEDASNRYGIKVNLSEVDLLSQHLARSYIVTVYQSADCFLREFRKEYCILYHKDWHDDDQSDLLTMTLNNISPEKPEAVIDNYLTSRFQYYRIVRNMVVHTKGTEQRKPLEMFSKIVTVLPEFEELKSPLPLVNPPDAIAFDDFICFSRVTKLIAKKICIFSKPSDTHWITSIPINRFKRFQNNPKRMLNSIIGYISTEFGMDTSSAKWIAQEICKPKKDVTH